MAGYSGAPLQKKLGFKEGQTIAILDPPDTFDALLGPLPEGVNLRSSGRGKVDVVVFFTKEASALEKRIDALGRMIFPAGGLWVAWPKRTSKVPTDMSENRVRDIAIPTGLVDTKVCAIDDIWSGLRLVWRRSHR
ncbi:MAG: DUF3052 domain-containing protein [Acidimicrobiales bacterium]